MLLLALLATAAQTIQCNTVDTAGRTIPYAIDRGLDGDRPTLAIRAPDADTPAIVLTKVTARHPTRPITDYSFDATIVGARHTGVLRRAVRYGGERWQLELTATTGKEERLPVLVGICGDGFLAARSGEQPEVSGPVFSCYAAMLAGRSFAFTYGIAARGPTTITATDTSLWHEGKAAVSGFGPRGWETDGLFRDSAIVAPAEGTRGPHGMAIVVLNRATRRGSAQFELFDLDYRGSRQGGPESPGIALCRHFDYTP